MPRVSDPTDPRIPLNSLIFGYGPMLPLAAAAIGVWTLPGGWAILAVQLAVIWGALILTFVAGVRRGFGFGRPSASTPVEIATMLAYFIPAGLSLVVPGLLAALLLLIVGFALAIGLDVTAARRGDAPAHFARLRPPQFSIAILSLGALALRYVL